MAVAEAAASKKQGRINEETYWDEVDEYAEPDPLVGEAMVKLQFRELERRHWVRVSRPPSPPSPGPLLLG